MITIIVHHKESVTMAETVSFHKYSLAYAYIIDNLLEDNVDNITIKKS